MFLVNLPFPKSSALFDLIRLPAALSVPGDTLAGAVAADSLSLSLRPASGLASACGLASASCCLYWAGMALNDYADRDVDAVERPHRPIPSGEVSPEFALRFAQALTVTGLGLAAVAGGKRGALNGIALAAAIWSYDMSLKKTKAGPLAMAACRTLDVLLGSSRGSLTNAIPTAVIVGAHTFALTTVSQQEVEGGTSEVPRRVRMATTAITAATCIVVARSATKAPTKAAKCLRISSAFGLLATFAKPLLHAQTAAVNEPTPKNMQKVVGTSIHAMIPLQGTFLAAKGKFMIAGLISGGWPLARHLARKRAVT